jgi:hypothetical protein
VSNIFDFLINPLSCGHYLGMKLCAPTFIFAFAMGCGSNSANTPDGSQNPDANGDIPTPEGAYPISRPAPGGVGADVAIDFGSSEINSAASAKSIRLFNGGVTQRSLQVTLSASTVFAVDAQSTCSATLPAGQECNLILTYTPTAAGQSKATLDVSTDLGPVLRVGLVGTAAPLPNGLRINFASDAGTTGGRVEVEQDVPAGDPATNYGTCYQSCTLQVPAGTKIKLTATTLFGSKAFTGDCTGDTQCLLTRSAVNQDIAIRFGANEAVNEKWTRPVDMAVSSVTIDTADHVIVGGNGFVKALSATGDALWTSTMTARHLEAGLDGTVYGHSADTLYKLSATGDMLWSRVIGECIEAVGISRGYQRCFATNANGEIAIGTAQGIQVIDASGATLRTLPAGGVNSQVTIDNNGVVYLVIESPTIPPEIQAARRFSNTGAELAITDYLCTQYHTVIVATIDPIGVVCASSGHSHSDIFGRSFILDAPSYLPVGAATAGTGDVAWIANLTDLYDQVGWTMERLSSTGQLKSAVNGPPSSGFVPSKDTFNPNQIAAGKSGAIAIAGAGFGGGFVTVFHP